MFNNIYWKWDAVIPKETCNHLLKSFDWSQETDATHYNMSKGEYVLNKKVRDTKVIWLNPLSVVGCIAHTYIQAANASAGWNFDLTHMEHVQIGKYEKGGHYLVHRDSNGCDEARIQRKLSFTLLLNDPKEFEGGQFEFQEIKKPIDLQQGSILVFPSVVNHRVKPVTKGVRYSAVTWMNGPAFR